MERVHFGALVACVLNSLSSRANLEDMRSMKKKGPPSRLSRDAASVAIGTLRTVTR